MAESAEMDAEQFGSQIADWLAFDVLDESQIGDFNSSFLIGRFDFEQGHTEPNLVNRPRRMPL